MARSTCVSHGSVEQRHKHRSDRSRYLPVPQLSPALSRLALGLKSAKDLSFGRREGFLARYERANALPARPRVGRARVRPFFPVGTALAAVAPPQGRQLGAKC